MRSFPRILAVVSVVALMMLFFFPLWQVTLNAPQFPEGITMEIWINKIGGNSPSVLQNINILNHYVGMQKIEPDSIPELQFFPYVVLCLALMGLVAAVVNKPWFYLTWGIIFLILAVAGIYDFYLWEYDYGHNLDPKAPIKVPGQSYQPPLIGTKMILNFKASSYPATGGIFMGASLVLSALAYWFSRKASKIRSSY